MPTITINIPDPIANRVIQGFAQRHGYSDTLEDGSPNPETRSQFAKRILIQYIKNSVREAEIQTASNTAATTAGQSADTDIQLS